ncbi:methyl-accepting chemotaxis protein [Pelagibaculum spongiae]|uniref:Chemotaxis protein n=1 Tax=Pelagibaculum spongiae TaxID=2080658 RepID=A0A2V1H199_9GAMM|nr:methyl-accepting chemotaxis protein [Pelagibaculum spongiae]PVZ72273.1 chemotaxis protein [Pelagibaculum spongiae]
MKEVKFRWIDKYLIQLRVKSKFMILGAMAILALVGQTYWLVSHYENGFVAYQQRMDQQYQQQVQQLIDSAPGNLQPSQQSQLTQALQQQPKLSSVVTEEQAGFYQKILLALTFMISLIAIGNYYISTFVGGALFTTVNALKNAANGDLTGRLKFFEVPDEFSILAVSIDALVERQHKLVSQITQASSHINQIVETFRGNANQGKDMAENQRQHLDSLAVAMSQMTEAVSEVARNAELSSNETHLSNQQVATGSNDILQTVDAINQLSTEISDASNAVTDLNENASRIDEVVTTINGISEQTNLLALNAAIEAARAGEQGRGFAVVADEVRTLAGRTQQATVEIKSMIEALQTGSHNLTQVISSTVERAEFGKQNVSQTGDDLQKIALHSGKILEMSALIATSADQQSSVASDISASILKIRDQSLDVETSATGAVAGCDELQQTSDRMQSLLTGLKI